MTETATARAALMRLLTAKWLPPVIGVLAELGIADELAAGPRTAKELAGSTGAHPGALHRLLDDIEMLVIAGGVDRDEREYGELLAAGGFAVRRVTPCGDRFSLIEALVR